MLNDYQMFCVSVRGYSHIQEGTPKEDDAGMLKTGQGWIGVVSDGHGDPRCMRSSVGSRLAVETAIENLKGWLGEESPLSDENDNPFAETGRPSEEKREETESEEIAAAAGPDEEPKAVPVLSVSASEEKGSPDAGNGGPESPDPASEATSDGTKLETVPESIGQCPQVSAPAPVPAQEAPADRLDQIPGMSPKKTWSSYSIQNLCSRIAIQWQERVQEHYRNNPLSEEEIKAAGNLYPSYAAGKRIPHIYGATLLAAVMTDSRMLLIQKGDGHAMFIYEDGTTSHEVIPWDDRCELNFTTSLCDEDAAETFRWAVVDLKEKPGLAAVMLASDGLEDCYADMDAAEVFVGQTAVFGAREGMENLESYLQSELSGMSERASRDDISVVGWIFPSAVLPLRRRFDLLAEYYRAQNRLKEARLHIGSMTGSKQRLEQRMKKMEEDLARLKDREKELEEKGKALSEQKADTQTRIQENPFMRALHSLIVDMRLTDADFRTQAQTYWGTRDTLSREQEEIDRITSQQESTRQELAALQSEYDELAGKYTSYAARYQQWADQQRDAETALARINSDLSAPMEPEEAEAEDAEDAFRRMMEEG